MKWRSINEKPNSMGEMRVLLANFSDNGFLIWTMQGWWYPKDGEFVPNVQREFTHWMPYSEYWEAMSNLDRE